jgi:serine O-acetyltransferase
MDLNKWLNSETPGIAGELEQLNRKYFFNEKTIGFAGKESIGKMLELLKSALFPGVFDKCPITEDRVNVLIGNNIRVAAVELNSLVETAYKNTCSHYEEKRATCDECREKAYEVTTGLISRLPYIRDLLHSDIKAAYEGDPAAKSKEEILLSYPSVTAVTTYRLANALYDMGVPVIPRVMSEIAHEKTGIDIHPGAKIGCCFFIDHGTGVVIGETCVIGSRVKIYQGVTLGAKSFKTDSDGNPIKGIKRHPNIEDNVVIYAGATILGGDTTIGHDSVIGGNVWLTHSVPPYSIVINAQPMPEIKNNNENRI